MLKMIVIILFPFFSNATSPPLVQSCSEIMYVAPPESEWHLSLEQLIKKKEFVFVGEVKKIERSDLPSSIRADSKMTGGIAVDPPTKNHAIGQIAYTFEISEILKGSSSAKTFSLIAKKEVNSKFHGMSCSGAVTFELNKRYLVVSDSFNPFGYQEIDSTKNAWYRKVKKLVHGNGSPK